MTRDQLEDLEQAELARRYEAQLSKIRHDLYEAIGITPTYDGKLWTVSGRPNLVSFDEALQLLTERITNIKNFGYSTPPSKGALSEL